MNARLDTCAIESAARALPLGHVEVLKGVQLAADADTSDSESMQIALPRVEAEVSVPEEFPIESFVLLIGCESAPA